MRRNRNFSILLQMRLITIQLVMYDWFPSLAVDRREVILILLDQEHLSPFNPYFVFQDKATRLTAGSLLSLAIMPKLILGSQVNNQAVFFSLFSNSQSGGDEGTRTPDFRLAKAALSQLSYIPRGKNTTGLWA
jgi:hypothetical protein